MPLLRPPLPEVTRRKYYIRIDEPLAVKLDSYAEFLDAKSVEYVIAEALDFVFKKDTEFNKWLNEHGTVTQPRLSRLKAKPNGSAAAQGTPKTEPAIARTTI